MAVWPAVALALALPGLVFADELLPPLGASSDVLFNPAACGPGRPAAISGAHLVARTADRALGPYVVQLDSFSPPGGPDTTRPILIEADAGTTLRIDLDNQLEPRPGMPPRSDTNLHTHGLIVSPMPYDIHRPCPGDSVYQVVHPRETVRQYRIDIPDRLPASFFGLGSPAETVAHPSGLFWFHAHLHMVARPQVTSGLSGLISIGDPMTHLRVDREDPETRLSQVDETATHALRAQTDVRYLALRDIQVEVPPCPPGASGCDPAETLPDHAGAQGLRATVADYNPALCAPGADLVAPLDAGFCARHLTNGGDRNAVWMFTVNGQSFPTVTAGPGRNQLLRVANLSASLTYVLDLVDASASDRTASEVPLCVVSLDGVVTGSTSASCPGQAARSRSIRYASVGFGVKRLLLMPGSRAELFLPFDATAGEQPRALVLRTLGLNMGDSDPATQGDVWPPIDLARIELAARPPDGAAPGPALRANLVRTGSAHEPALPEAARVLKFDAAATRRAHAGCVLLPAGSNAHRRQIIFDEAEANGHDTFAPATTAAFALGSRVVDRDGSPEPGTLIGPAAYGAGHMTGMDHLPSGPHVCPVLGRGEVWELRNYTTETHNFHIHQGKFRLARPGDPGLPAGFTGPVVGQSAADSPVMAFIGEENGAGDVQAWHDTLPVPPRIGPAQPGQLFVFIPFGAEQQVGHFVFHCHILEHEDKGMMADVEVVRPARRGRS